MVALVPWLDQVVTHGIGLSLQLPLLDQLVQLGTHPLQFANQVLIRLLEAPVLLLLAYHSSAPILLFLLKVDFSDVNIVRDSSVEVLRDTELRIVCVLIPHRLLLRCIVFSCYFSKHASNSIETLTSLCLKFCVCRFCCSIA